MNTHIVNSLNQIEIARIYLRQASSNKKNADGDYPITTLCIEHAALILRVKQLERYNSMLKEALENTQEIITREKKDIK